MVQSLSWVWKDDFILNLRPEANNDLAHLIKTKIKRVGFGVITSLCHTSSRYLQTTCLNLNSTSEVSMVQFRPYLAHFILLSTLSGTCQSRSTLLDDSCSCLVDHKRHCLAGSAAPFYAATWCLSLASKQCLKFKSVKKWRTIFVLQGHW